MTSAFHDGKVLLCCYNWSREIEIIRQQNETISWEIQVVGHQRCTENIFLSCLLTPNDLYLIYDIIEEMFPFKIIVEVLGCDVIIREHNKMMQIVHAVLSLKWSLSILQNRSGVKFSESKLIVATPMR